MLGLELFNFTFHSLTRLWKGIIDSTKNDSFNFISKCKIWQTFDFVYTAIRHIYFCCWQNCCSRFTLSACWFRKNMSCIFHPILQILFQFHHMLHLMTYISIQSLVKGETFRVNLGFLSDPIIPGVWMSLTHRRFWDLTDMTLADEDTNSTLTDNTNRAIQGNVTMQKTWLGGQMSLHVGQNLNQC